MFHFHFNLHYSMYVPYLLLVALELVSPVSLVPVGGGLYSLVFCGTILIFLNPFPPSDPIIKLPFCLFTKFLDLGAFLILFPPNAAKGYAIAFSSLWHPFRNKSNITGPHWLAHTMLSPKYTPGTLTLAFLNSSPSGINVGYVPGFMAQVLP